MSPELNSLLSKPDERRFEDAYFDGQVPEFLGIDWRAPDDEIIGECAEYLQLDSLQAVWNGDRLYISFEGEQSRVPLLEDAGDRHITICRLNDVLEGKYQLRMIVVSHGSDTIGLAALPVEEWTYWESASPQMIEENFIDPRLLPNMITDLTDTDLPIPARARYLRMANRSMKR